MITPIISTIQNIRSTISQKLENKAKIDDIQSQYTSNVLNNIGSTLVGNFVKNTMTQKTLNNQKKMANTNIFIKNFTMHKMNKQMIIDNKCKEIVQKAQNCPIELTLLKKDKLKAIPVGEKYSIVSDEGFNAIIESEKNNKRKKVAAGQNIGNIVAINYMGKNIPIKNCISGQELAKDPKFNINKIIENKDEN